MPRRSSARSKRARGEHANVATTHRGRFARAECERTKRLKKIPADALERFRCALWSCELSRFACASRWTRAQIPQPRGSAYDMRSREGPYARCAKCPIGRDNAALVPADSLTKKKSDR